MHNPLKRQSSVDDLNDPSHNIKRTKHIFNDALSPSLHSSYTDHHSLTESHLPPSPPVIVDTPLPSPFSAACIDSIPTLQRFTITTRQQVTYQPYDSSTADYANINQILYEAHIERNKDTFTSEMDTDMMDDRANHYDYANAVLRQAFLQRHPSPP